MGRSLGVDGRESSHASPSPGWARLCGTTRLPLWRVGDARCALAEAEKNDDDMVWLCRVVKSGVSLLHVCKSALQRRWRIGLDGGASLSRPTRSETRQLLSPPRTWDRDDFTDEMRHTQAGSSRLGARTRYRSEYRHRHTTFTFHMHRISTYVYTVCAPVSPTNA